MKTKSISVKILCVVFALMLASVSIFAGCGSKSTSSTEQEATQKVSAKPAPKPATQPAEASEDLNKDDAVKIAIDVKDYGTIKAELYPNIAPITVENFVKLVNEKFYDGLTFHRIIDGFMIQGGDPLGNGTGGSPDKIKGEFSSNGVENNLSHKKGVISMARSMDPNSASSQFFIVQTDSTSLDGEYAAFGEVTEGLDIVDKIAKDAKPTDNNGTIKAEEQPVINSISIEE